MSVPLRAHRAYAATAPLVAAPLALAALLLTPGCRGDPLPTLPPGTWFMDQDTTLAGHLSGELVLAPEGHRLSLWSERWSTGEQSASATLIPDDGRHPWLSFPLETALGLGQAVITLAPDRSRAMVPLGSREGELELIFTLTPGPLPAELRLQALSRSAAGLAAQQAAWADGRFTVHSEDGQPVGTVRLLPLNHSIVEFYDVTMMTAGEQVAMRRDEGPDIVLTFPVEPSFQGEPGELRLNVPTGRAVLPTALMPTALDRWLVLRPGSPSEEERQAYRRLAHDQALERERSWLLVVGRNLAVAAQQARAASGECPEAATMGDDWQQVLADYDVSIHTLEGRCQVALAPTVIQHTRRLAARLEPSGVISVEVLGDGP